MQEVTYLQLAEEYTDSWFVHDEPTVSNNNKNFKQNEKE